MGRIKDDLVKKFEARRKANLPAPSPEATEAAGEIIETRIQEYKELTGQVPDPDTVSEISEQVTKNVITAEAHQVQVQADQIAAAEAAAAQQAQQEKQSRRFWRRVGATNTSVDGGPLTPGR